MRRLSSRMWNVGVPVLIVLMIIVTLSNHRQASLWRAQVAAYANGIDNPDGTRPDDAPRLQKLGSLTEADRSVDNVKDATPERKDEELPFHSKAEITKTVVMGRLWEEDTNWVAETNPDWKRAIYVVDLFPDETSPTGLSTRMNKAKEAMPYLTYIVDNYPNFTDVVAFIHPHRNELPQAWHTDARGHDAGHMLEDLQLLTVLKRGYVNLRCLTQNPGCPAEVQPYRNPPDPGRHAEHAFPELYATFFDLPLSTVRERIPIVATACCAQFAVSKAQLLTHPKSFYERIMRTLEETELDNDTSGRVMEYMWHLIFGREAVHCPDPYVCYCEVYGRCRLKHRPPGKPNRFRLSQF